MKICTKEVTLIRVGHAEGVTNYLFFVLKKNCDFENLISRSMEVALIYASAISNGIVQGL